MKSNQSFRRTLSSLLAITALLALLTSCATYRSGQATPDSHGSAESATRLAKGGAQLWAENCARCHSFRSPGSYSATPSGTSPSIICAFAPISPLRIHARFSRFFRRATDRNSCPDKAKNQSSEMIKFRRIKVVNTTQTIGGIRIHGWSSDSFVLPLRLAPPASATMAACAPRNRSATRLLVDVGFRSAVGSSFAQKWRELSLLEIPPPKFIGSLRQLGSREFPISNRRAAL
jgi:hypothetical protein